MNSIIVARHLSYRYRSGQAQNAALEDINLDIERGSCVGIIGVTGSGKTTLVQHFNGLLRPTTGQVMVDGIDVGTRGADLRVLRQRVGMLFQFPESQLFGQTVYADVAFGPQRMHLSKREVRSRVIAALDIVGLPHHDYASRSPFDLSGGQRRRIALAGALAMHPTLLILDEPTAGLDANARADLYSCLQRLQRDQNVTTVLVSHDMAEVATLADKLLVLHQGRLVMQGTPRSIFADVEQLHAWGLAVPPLNELLAQLRQYHIAVPKDILTLDEAFTFFVNNTKYKFAGLDASRLRKKRYR